MGTQQDAAQALALRALGYLAGEEGLLQGFLGQSGLDLATLRARAAEPELLGAVLDFILGDDSMVLALAAHLHCRPEEVLTARAALPGGDVPHWT